MSVRPQYIRLFPHDGRCCCVRLPRLIEPGKIPSPPHSSAGSWVVQSDAEGQDITLPLAAPLIETRLNDLVPQRQGKVRDIFDCGNTLVMVATDRISAFDYVLGSGIPDKGKVLTQLSVFWFERTTGIVPNHFVSADAHTYPEPLRRHGEVLSGRSMLVRKTTPVPIECVARGYLSGSGWKEYVA